jgi:natural product biosynthesis luciferase-like monooxygenase protein
MDTLSQRIKNLSTAQRDLLAQRLQQNSHDAHAPTPAEAPPAATMRPAAPALAPLLPSQRALQFGLFFFSDKGAEAGLAHYLFLIDCAKFADEHGFSSIWTPERHFQNFGGLYPNPALLSAALAMVTKRIHIRAGSVVLPIHSPIRVAEEWALVDNLSAGRVGISFASGWHPEDFVFFPEKFERRKEIMFHDIEVVQKLWAGEQVTFRGVGGADVAVRILPNPIQPRLPTWVTSSGNPETWMLAGQIGANIMTSMASLALPDLAKNIALYRASLAQHGWDAQRGQVTVMLHTFIGEDLETVREKVRLPLYEYFRTYLNQYNTVPSSISGVAAEDSTEANKDTLVPLAFERYFKASSLLGTPEKCMQILDQLQQIGVTEIACLVDFGLDTASIMESLHLLKDVRLQYAQAGNGMAVGLAE